MKQDNRIYFTDKAIANVKHADIKFTYTNKEGQVQTRPFIDIPFKTLKQTRLKGLKLRVFRNGGIYFILQYWFTRKSKKITLGEYIPGVFGKKQVEDKLYKITEKHLNEKGHWSKDPLISEHNKTRVITKDHLKEIERKTINEVRIDFYK